MGFIFGYEFIEGGISIVVFKVLVLVVLIIL